jgi:uncharacterized protein YjiK
MATKKKVEKKTNTGGVSGISSITYDKDSNVLVVVMDGKVITDPKEIEKLLAKEG